MSLHVDDLVVEGALSTLSALQAQNAASLPAGEQKMLRGCRIKIKNLVSGLLGWPGSVVVLGTFSALTSAQCWEGA